MRRFIVLIFVLSGLIAQPEFTPSVFKATRLMNNATTELLYMNTFEFRVQHRFGDTYGGIYTFFGEDDGAATNIGVDWAIVDWWMMGTTRMNFGKTWEFHNRLRLWRQRYDDSMPMTVVLNTAIDIQTLKQNEFHYYGAQLLLSRKFTKRFTAQIGPFAIHRPRFESDIRPNPVAAVTIYGTSLASRFLVTKRHSIVVEYSLLFNRSDYNDASNANFEGNYRFEAAEQQPYNSLSIGYNIQSGGHTYQILFSNTRASGLFTHLIGSNADALKRHFFMGFNITRLFQLDF